VTTTGPEWGFMLFGHGKGTRELTEGAKAKTHGT